MPPPNESTTTTVTTPSTSKTLTLMPTKSLLSLPPDILHTLLLHIPTFSTLHSLLLTHPIFNSLYTQHPTQIITALSHRVYPPYALRLLHYASPTALAPQVRSFITTSTDGMWGHSAPSPLLSPKQRITLPAAIRLRSDAQTVTRLISWAEGVMEGREIVGYVDHKGISAEGGNVVYPLFDGEGVWAQVSDSERERARRGVYRILGLAGCFHWIPSPTEGDGEGEEADETGSGRIVFDCTEVLTMPLEELFYMHALLLYFSTWSFSCELMRQDGICRLVNLLEYRVYDDRKVRDMDESWDLRYSVEYLRRVSMRDRWQNEVLEMVETSKGDRGFDGGYKSEMFEEQIIMEGGEEKKILVLKST